MDARSTTPEETTLQPQLESEESENNGRIPGNRGMWAGILAEMTEFGLLFGVYFVARFYNPESFQLGPGQINTLAGTANTVMMISGSYFVAKAIQTIRIDNRAATLRWLFLVLLTIVGYATIKSLEIQWNIENGVNGRSGVFFTVYYYLTFTHMVHVLWGGMGLLWIMLRTHSGHYSSESHEGMESFASYWHATDLVWLVIFPLLYLLR
jgi:cytochrome c oxidase subunit 3